MKHRIRASGLIAAERSLEMRDCECWLAKFLPALACDRPNDMLWRVHLIPKARLRQEGADPMDPRSFVWACGGWNGLRGHHQELDAYVLRVPYVELPQETVDLAAEAGLLGWLQNRYGAVVEA